MTLPEEIFLTRLSENVDTFEWERDLHARYLDYSTVLENGVKIRVFANAESGKETTTVQVFNGRGDYIGECLDSTQYPIVTDILNIIKKNLVRKQKDVFWGEMVTKVFGE